MQIKIRTKNIDLTVSLKSFINNKLGVLKKLMGEDVSDILVDVERQTNHHKKGDVYWTEANVNLDGKKLFAKAHGDDVFKTILEVKEELEREIKRYKTKAIDLARRNQRKAHEEIEN